MPYSFQILTLNYYIYLLNSIKTIHKQVMQNESPKILFKNELFEPEFYF
jgi:hypothetical protein